MAEAGDRKAARDRERREFVEQAELPPGSLFREYLGFLLTGKRWYLTPIVVLLFLIGLIGFLGSTVAAPLIYTLF